MAIIPRFPRLDPHTVPDGTWREVPISSLQEMRLEESYNVTLRRRRPQYVWDRMVKPCPGHLWLRMEGGPWVCERCPEERWTL